MKHSLNHLKKKCAACEREGVKMNKEHLFPKWLILKTNTHNTGIRWGDKRKIPALKATLPLCQECNSLFGKELEAPVSKLFDEIEKQKGISDLDAELLIRWLWKIYGLAWVAAHPHDKYTSIYTIKERVLRPIDFIRENLVLAVSLIEALHPESIDWPMGVDSNTSKDAIFVSGVFSKIALMVLLDPFAYLVPKHFSLYHLAPKREKSSKGKLFYPKIGFVDDLEAVSVTRMASIPIAKEHDNFWEEIEH